MADSLFETGRAYTLNHKTAHGVFKSGFNVKASRGRNQRAKDF
jgi:hypothetical protein